MKETMQTRSVEVGLADSPTRALDQLEGSELLRLVTEVLQRLEVKR